MCHIRPKKKAATVTENIVDQMSRPTPELSMPEERMAQQRAESRGQKDDLRMVDGHGLSSRAIASDGSQRTEGDVATSHVLQGDLAPLVWPSSRVGFLSSTFNHHLPFTAVSLLVDWRHRHRVFCHTLRSRVSPRPSPMSNLLAACWLDQRIILCLRSAA